MQPIITALLAAMAMILSGAFFAPMAVAGDDTAALTKALPEATVPLQQALTASEKEGKPISGKYELEDGALQLSVYTARDGKYTEVIIDHKSGAIKKAEAITSEEDLSDAREQNEAMSSASVPLSSAASRAATANPGYTVVRAIPALKNGHPVAAIELLKDGTVKEVEQKLD